MSEKEVLCPACGAEMERKLQNFTIGTDGGGGLLSSLLYQQYDVDLYVCPQCGKVELYTANFQKKEEKAGEKAEEREDPGEVVCPVCGTRHSALINCPTCVMNKVTGRKPDRKPDPAPAGPKKKSRRPPWEK